MNWRSRSRQRRCGRKKKTLEDNLRPRTGGLHFAIEDWNEVAFRRGSTLLRFTTESLKPATDD